MLLKISPLFFPLAYILSIKLFRITGDWLFHQIAIKKNVLKLPAIHRFKNQAPANLKFSKYTNAVLIFLVFYTLFLNIIGIKRLQLDPPGIVYLPGILLGLTQRWSLFAPPPIASNLLYAKGLTKNNERVNLTEGYDTSIYNYKFPDQAYPTHRWKKLAENISRGYLRKEYSDYLCRSWKILNPSNNLTEVQLIHRKIVSKLDGTYSPAIDKPIFYYDCGLKQEIMLSKDSLKN